MQIGQFVGELAQFVESLLSLVEVASADEGLGLQGQGQGCMSRRCPVSGMFGFWRRASSMLAWSPRAWASAATATIG